MKKVIKVIGITLLAGGLLVACNNDEDTDTPANNDDNGTSDEQVEHDDNGVEEDIDNEGTDDSDGNIGGGDGAGTGGELGDDQEFGDQLELGIGDTAQISGNQGSFEITIDSIEYTAESVDGESSVLDAFIIVDLSVRNIGETTLDRETTIGILESTDRLEGSGVEDFSHQFESIDGIEGEIQPGEEVKGQTIYDIRDSEEQFIRINPGLIAAEGVYNDVVWYFNLEEIK